MRKGVLQPNATVVSDAGFRFAVVEWSVRCRLHLNALAAIAPYTEPHNRQPNQINHQVRALGPMASLEKSTTVDRINQSDEGWNQPIGRKLMESSKLWSRNKSAGGNLCLELHNLCLFIAIRLIIKNHFVARL